MPFSSSEGGCAARLGWSLGEASPAATSGRVRGRGDGRVLGRPYLDRDVLSLLMESSPLRWDERCTCRNSAQECPRCPQLYGQDQWIFSPGSAHTPGAFPEDGPAHGSAGLPGGPHAKGPRRARASALVRRAGAWTVTMPGPMEHSSQGLRVTAPAFVGRVGG